MSTDPQILFLKTVLTLPHSDVVIDVFEIALFSLLNIFKWALIFAKAEKLPPGNSMHLAKSHESRYYYGWKNDMVEVL